MYSLNRHAVLLNAKQPMADWINKHDPENTVALEDVNQDANLYLVPPTDSPESTQQEIEQNWAFFFENELDEWHADEEIWPANRTLAMFKGWFDIRVISVVYDAADEEIEREEI